jgi:hypothetical protein
MLEDGAYDEKKVENDGRKVGKDPYRQHLCNTRFMKPCMDNKLLSTGRFFWSLMLTNSIHCWLLLQVNSQALSPK